MKKKVIFVMLVLSVLLLTSCKPEDIPVPAGEQIAIEQPAETPSVPAEAGEKQEPATEVPEQDAVQEEAKVEEPAQSKPTATPKPVKPAPKVTVPDTAVETPAEPETENIELEPEKTEPSWQTLDSGLPLITRAPGFPDIVPVEYQYTDMEAYSIATKDYTAIDFNTLNMEETALPSGAKYYTFSMTTTDGEPIKGNAFEYKPGENIVCRASCGEVLADTPGGVERESVSELVKYERSLGFDVAAAVNGSYYILLGTIAQGERIGTPKDLVIRDGWIASSDGSQRAIGFYADGTAIIGRPYGKTVMTVNDSEEEVELININKTQGAGTTLYTSDFSDTTGSIVPSIEVVAKIEEGRLGFGATLTVVVEKIGEYVQSTPLEDGYVVLSAPMSSGFELSGLKLGDTLKFTTTSYDKRWNNVVSAVGGEDLIMTGGEVILNEAFSPQPRTAVGIKPDGTVVVMVVDGRSAESVGASKVDLGYLFEAFGCTDALNLDGGGSTTMVVDFTGDGTDTVVNTPSSNGVQRKNSNGLVFVVIKKEE